MGDDDRKAAAVMLVLVLVVLVVQVLVVIMSQKRHLYRWRCRIVSHVLHVARSHSGRHKVRPHPGQQHLRGCSELLLIRMV